jgi:hypothetical protein
MSGQLGTRPAERPYKAIDAHCVHRGGRYRIRPFVIVDGLMANKELAHYGYDESNVILLTQANAFMTSILFEAWTKKMLFLRSKSVGSGGTMMAWSCCSWMTWVPITPRSF